MTPDSEYAPQTNPIASPMLRWSYQAISQNGKRCRGQLHARHLHELETRLGQQQLQLIDAKPTSNWSEIVLARLTPTSRRELLHFTFSLTELLRSGIPLIEGLHDLETTMEAPRLRHTLDAILQEVGAGQTLSQAFASHPALFDPVFVALVAAGESSGSLPETLERARESLEWQEELGRRLHSLLIYPTLVASVVLASCLFLIIFLAPKVKGLAGHLGHPLPVATQWLLDTSSYLAGWWLPLLGLFMLLMTTGIVLFHTHTGFKTRWQMLLNRTPLLGPVIQKIELARFSGVLALLHRSGIPIIEALGTALPVVRNLPLKIRIEIARTHIMEGRGITESFAQTQYFPAFILRMLQLGEHTGRFDDALENVRKFYERDVKTSVDRALTSIEPLLTLFMGLLLMGVLITVLGPVYELIGKIGS